MNWGIITEDWRFKLLAVGLAVLMLGAVAFSQNPPTSGSVTISVVYSPGPNLVLISPPNKISVTYTGLADVIKSVNANNTVAQVDATHAHPGAAVRLPVTVSSISGVTVQTPPPIVVQIDTWQEKDLQVQVNARAAPGWSINQANTRAECPPKPSPCVVHFGGPASWETNLAAIVALPGQVSYTGPATAPNLPVQLQNANGFLDLTCKTVPCATLDVVAVNVHIEASQGSTLSSVALVDAPPSHPPANGYRVNAIAITPNTVTISGDPVTLGKIRSITLTPVDLSGRTSDAVFQVAIPYPGGVTGEVQNATVKYFISANPNASPGP